MDASRLLACFVFRGLRSILPSAFSAVRREHGHGVATWLAVYNLEQGRHDELL